MKLRLHFEKKDKIFYSYLISYLVICLISIFLTFFGYLNAEELIRKEILTSQSYMLTQLQNSFDYYVNTVLKINRTLSGNEGLQSLMKNAGFSADDLLALNQLKSELSNSKKSMDFSKDMAVYFYKSNSFVTTGKRYASETSYMYTEQFNMSNEKFLSFINISYSQGYKILKTGDKDYSLFFIQNIYNYNYKSKLATIFTIVPWDNIANNIAAIENGQVYWINEDGQILKGPGSSVPLISVNYDDFKVENQLNDIKIARDTYIGSYKKSQYLDFKYCILILKSSYFKPISYMKLISGIQIVVALMIAFALSFYYSIRNYHPISQIINIFRNYNKMSDEPVNFDKIGKYLENLMSENRSLTNSWKHAKIELSNQVFSGFIKGWSSDIDTLRETIATTESITLKETDYVVLLVAYRDVANCNLFKDVRPEREAISYQLLQYVFNDIFTEKILSKFTGMLCSFEGTYLCIANLDDKENTEEKLNQSIAECISWYRETLNLNLMVGASNIHKDFESLPKAYNEASQVISFQMFWGASSETLMYYDESASAYNSENSSTLQFLENEKKLHNLLVAKDFEKAYALLDNIMDESFIRDINYMSINQCRMYSLINTFYSSLSDIFVKDNKELLRKLKSINRLLESNSIDKAKQVMKDIFDDVLKYVSTSLIDEQPKWLTDIVEFVDRHYSEPNLNISIIADHVDMNLTYVGRTFKKNFGYGLTDYIHIQRLKECKHLLEIGKNVREAAEAVGYLDSKTLIRIFKKYEGITPGQFRNMSHK